HLIREGGGCAWNRDCRWRIGRGQRGLRWEEPRPVVPAPEWIAASKRVCRVLVWHVDVREPEVPVTPSCGKRRCAKVSVPGWVLRVELRLAGNERFVLDDQRDQMREIASSDAAGSGRCCQPGFLGRIVQKITGGLSCINIQPRDAVGMIVIEHQPPTLLVRPVEGHVTRGGRGRGAWRQRAWITRSEAVGSDGRRAERNDSASREKHVRDRLSAHSIHGSVTLRRRPLVRRTITDPRSCSAV